MNAEPPWVQGARTDLSDGTEVQKTLSKNFRAGFNPNVSQRTRRRNPVNAEQTAC